MRRSILGCLLLAVTVLGCGQPEGSSSATPETGSQEPQTVRKPVETATDAPPLEIILPTPEVPERVRQPSPAPPAPAP